MPIFQTVAKGDSNTGSLDCESGILPLSYRAPQREGGGEKIRGGRDWTMSEQISGGRGRSAQPNADR